MALRVANRGYVLETGTIAHTGTGLELLGDPRVKEAYLGGEIAVYLMGVSAFVF